MVNTFDSAKYPGNPSIGFGGETQIRGRRSVTIGIPDRSAPTACAVIGVGFALAAAGSVGTYSGGIRVAALEGVTPSMAGEKVLDRRRRYATASQALSEIRLWTGLAWASLAEMLKVSRRAVHHWASGEEPTGARAEALAELHGKAQEFSKHGQATAAALIASHYRIKMRPLRGSVRSVVNPGAILAVENSPVRDAPVSRGVRKLRRQDA